MKLLVTGFEPFGGECINPSWEAVRLLPDSSSGHTLVKLLLPVDYARASALLGDALREHSPDAVLSVGQAGGRADLALEKVALNQAGNPNAPPPPGFLSGHRIEQDAPAAYFATLPLDAVKDALAQAGIPASLSLSAGTYLCNFVMYCALHWAAQCSRNARCGFIHVPFLPEQAAAKDPPPPSMELTLIAKALEISIRAILS